MDNAPRQVLKELIVTHGAALVDNPQRCKGLLLDRCQEQRREINILIQALEEQVTFDLRQASVTPYPILQARLVKRLEDMRAMTEEAARWGVDSWALALGVIQQEPPVQKGPVIQKNSQGTGVQTPPPVQRGPTSTSPAVGTTLLTYRGHAGEVRAVAWAQHGRYLASGSSDNTVQVWDVTSGETLLTYHPYFVANFPTLSTVAWSPGGLWLACADYDRRVHVVAISETPRKLKGDRYFKLHKHTAAVSVAWSPDGRWLASGSHDKAVFVWNADSGATTLQYLKHTGPVTSVVWSPDGKRIASRGEAVHVWDASAGGGTFTYTGHTSPITSLNWSPDGRWIVSADAAGDVRVWDATTRCDLLTYSGHVTHHGQAQQVTAVAWSPDGQYIASGSVDTTVQIWDVVTGSTRTTYRGHSAKVHAVAWSPDGHRLASASADQTVQVWQAV